MATDPRPIMDELLSRIDERFREKRQEIVAETPPNEVQEWMTEGVLLGMDFAQKLVHEVFADG